MSLEAKAAMHRSSCPLSRRGFLASCSACLAGHNLAPAMSGWAAAEAARHPKVRLVFSHIPRGQPTWPTADYDYASRKAELTKRLVEACRQIEFLPATVHNQDEANKLLEQDKQRRIDGYVVYLVGLWTGAPQTIAAAGKPTVIVDDLFAGSGEFLIGYAWARRRRYRAVGVSSSRFDDVVAVVKSLAMLGQPGVTAEQWFAKAESVRKQLLPKPAELTCEPDRVELRPIDKCLAAMKRSAIVLVGHEPGQYASELPKLFGTRLHAVQFAELRAAHQEADQGEAERWAERWIEAAEKVIEPDRQAIVDAGRMHLAMQALLKKYKADTISINCLGGFYGGHLDAYPCLGYCQMNDGRQVGACEADMRSTITMLLIRHLTRRPGYISDPVIDTATNRIIYAHCVAPRRVFGPDGPTNPFHLRTHAEDGKGASVRSLMPLGYMTTTLEFDIFRKELIVHQGKSVANIDEPKACRTKLAVQVKGDIDKLMRYWDQWGWHRVTVYGDLIEPFAELAKAIGFKVTVEA